MALTHTDVNQAITSIWTIERRAALRRLWPGRKTPLDIYRTLNRMAGESIRSVHDVRVYAMGALQLSPRRGEVLSGGLPWEIE